jgi:hypothetical protein
MSRRETTPYSQLQTHHIQPVTLPVILHHHGSKEQVDHRTFQITQVSTVRLMTTHLLMAHLKTRAEIMLLPPDHIGRFLLLKRPSFRFEIRKRHVYFDTLLKSFRIGYTQLARNSNIC